MARPIPPRALAAPSVAVALIALTFGLGEAAMALGDEPAPIAAAVTAPAPDAGLSSDGESQRHSDGLFYVTARVNDRPLRFLIDTGASVTVLTADDAHAVGLRIDEAQFSGSVATVNGAASMAWATLDRVQVAGHDMRNVRAAVVRRGLGVSLLGQNMLARFKSVTLEADRIRLR